MTGNCKFINRLVDDKISEHAGRGDYSSFVCSYHEEKIFVNMDNFLEASPTHVHTKAHLNSPEIAHPVVWLTFSRGPDHSVFLITYAEFQRIFGQPWEDNTIPHALFQAEDTVCMS